jgi:acetyl esterase
VPLNPRLRERIDYEAAAFPDLTRIPIPEGREVSHSMAAENDRLAGPPPALDRVENRLIGGPSERFKVRLYFPPGRTSPSPVLAYLHGGGWVFGDLYTHDSLCRELAARSRIVVASVDYRLAPEHKFPAAIEDGYATLQWLTGAETCREFDLARGRIAVGGDSAGGNMAAVLSVLSRDRGGPALAGQVLLCPVTRYLPDTPSYSTNASGFGLDASFMPWMWEQYLVSPNQGEDPRVAPLRTPDLSHVAPALVITAEYDLLRDEGEAFAERLRQAQVPTRATRYSGMIHGFQDYRGVVREGWDAIEEIARTLRQWFEV